MDKTPAERKLDNRVRAFKFFGCLAAVLILIGLVAQPRTQKPIELDLSGGGQRGPTEEDIRRFRYEREQKQKDIAALQASLCDQQPYLDRCR